MTDEMREQVAKLGSTGEPVGPQKKLTEMDRLKLQNAFLMYHSVMTQRTNITTQMEVLRRDAATADEKLKEAQAALVKQRTYVEKEYGVDLMQCTVNEAGEFISLAQAKLPFPTNGGN